MNIQNKPFLILILCILLLEVFSIYYLEYMRFWLFLCFLQQLNFSCLDLITDQINTEKLSDKEVIVDKPIEDNDWERIWKKFCTERKLKDLVNIFPKGFDQSIFNQIFNDMKKSTDVTVYKEPEISFCQSSLHSQDIITQDKHVMNQLNGLWRDTYQIQLNPNMVNKYN